MFDEKIVSKPHSEWDDKYFALAKLKSKTISCIINGLICSEFHKTMNITCAKEMWNNLEAIHKKTNEIKKKQNQYVYTRVCCLTNQLMIFLIGSKASSTNFQITWESDYLFEMNNKV